MVAMFDTSKINMNDNLFQSVCLLAVGCIVMECLLHVCEIAGPNTDKVKSILCGQK